MKIRNYLLSGCLIAALCSCGTSQKENLNLTLSKDTLFDKVKGAWTNLGMYLWRSDRVSVFVNHDS